MSQQTGTAIFWEKKAPAAISKVGTKLAGFQNAPHRVVTYIQSSPQTATSHVSLDLEVGNEVARDD